MKALVTGADGFVGEHLVSRLVAAGQEVTAATQTLPPQRTILGPEQEPRVDWKAADVRDHDSLFRLIAASRPECIYHLAGFASGALARQQASEAVGVNAGGTVNLCEAVLATQADYPEFNPRILVMGSGDCYGDAAKDGQLLDERTHLRPLSPYGLSKACQELTAHTYRRAHGIRTFVVRGFTLIGCGQQPPFVVPEFCRQVAGIAAGLCDPAVRVGNLDVERDFMDVRDGVEAFRMLMDLEEPAATYNLASGEAISIRTILGWILDAAQVEAEIKIDPARVRREEVKRLVGDSTLLKSHTGWEPRRSVEQTIRETYEWWVRRLEGMSVSMFDTASEGA